MWLRSDLRLDDNPALLAAVSEGSPVIPVFIWDPESEEPWPPGAASRWWLHQSLRALTQRLSALESRLIVRRGPSLQTLEQILAETGATTVFWNRRYEPAVIARDSTIKQSLRDRGIKVDTFNAGLLFEPWTIGGKSTQRPFQVFSAFWKTCLSQPVPAAPQDAPTHIPRPSKWPKSLALADLNLEPRIKWAGGIKRAWEPGENGATAELTNFLNERSDAYQTERDRPDRAGTSRLSPHLHFGEISPRRIWHTLASGRTVHKAEALDFYLRELGWREFAHHLLFHFPQTPDTPLRSEFASFPWRDDDAFLKRWQRGETGYPLVDAGMRQLWATGWMHNRVRMVVASFLTKDLRINWTEGAYWFWDTLVDADLANNTLGWQWSAGCGADAAPYFRVFNPVRQSERFDPDGAYIHRWIPELKGLTAPWIHSPWAAPPQELAQAGIQLGKTYPQPIVDHDKARREALAAFQKTRKPFSVKKQA
jgi:deoxyribodipyrimidine photo-lyase